MTETRRRKALRYGAALLLLAAAWHLATRGPRFRPVRNGDRVAPGWTLFFAEGRHALTDPTGRRHPIALERTGHPEWTVRTRGARRFLVTRFEGGGSSGATYYSIYRLDPQGVAALTAAETRDWSSDDPDRCLDSPRVEAPPKDPADVFGACPNPEWREDAVIFRLPGHHCSMFQTGGCPREDLVRLE